ncbi:MAG TPA: hypothetical protein VFM54_06005 [Micromonosporaceae bacterium]|nr:hypothetical protein [Micromonosporaceae bacterium]
MAGEPDSSPTLGDNMADGFLDLFPDLVATAGGQTAATSGQWAAWAGRAETLLRNAAADAREPVVTAAVEDHLSRWNPRMQGLAANADALGTNAASAANVVANADTASAGVLSSDAATAYGAAGQLSRPITG